MRLRRSPEQHTSSKPRWTSISLLLASLMAIGGTEMLLAKPTQPTQAQEVQSTANQQKNSWKGIGALLIDMQECFLRGLPETKRKKLIAKQLEVLRFCRKNNMPVMVLEWKGYSGTIPELKTELNRNPNVRYLQKKHEDGFLEPEVGEAAKRLKLKSLVLMGAHTCACVKKTGMGALIHELDVTTAEDLVTTREGTPSTCTWWYSNCTRHFEAGKKVSAVMEGAKKGIVFGDKEWVFCVIDPQ